MLPNSIHKLAVTLQDKQTDKHNKTYDSHLISCASPLFSLNTISKYIYHRSVALFFVWLYFSAKLPPTDNKPPDSFLNLQQHLNLRKEIQVSKAGSQTHHIKCTFRFEV